MKITETQPLVCIVDDDASVRRALTRLVKSLGMRTESYGSPQELLDEGPSDDVGCFLLDIQLPGMDGFELHRRITADGLVRPVIFLTAHPDETKRSRSEAAGATAYLHKPFDEEALLRAIRLALYPALAGANADDPRLLGR